MSRFIRWRLTVCVAVSTCVFWGAPAVLFAEEPVRPLNLEMTPQTLARAPGQNKMVWVACPKVKTPPVIDGTPPGTR
jgi:hypothetical protein